MSEDYKLSRAESAWAKRQEQYGKDPSRLKELIIRQKGKCAFSGAPLYFDAKHGPDIHGYECHPLYAEVDYIMGRHPDYYCQIVCSQLNRMKDRVADFGKIPSTPEWAELMKSWKAQAEKDPMDITALRKLSADELSIEEEKISREDLIKALKRSKMYQEDYKHLDKEKLCRKYDLLYPIDPDKPYCEEELRYIRPFVDLFSYWEFRQRVNCNPRLKAFVHEILRELAVYQDGRLLLFIDTRFSRGQLEPEFKRILNGWIKKKRRRGGEDRVVNIWEVYDLHEKEANIAALSRSLFKSESSTKYSPKALARREQVKRALEKAERIIKLVEFKALPPRLHE